MQETDMLNTYLEGVVILNPYSLWVRLIREPGSRAYILLYYLLLVFGAAPMFGEHIFLQLKVELAELLQVHLA